MESPPTSNRLTRGRIKEYHIFAFIFFVFFVNLPACIIGWENYLPKDCQSIDLFLISYSSIHLIFVLIVFGSLFAKEDTSDSIITIIVSVSAMLTLGMTIWGSIVTFNTNGQECRKDYPEMWKMSLALIIFQYISLFCNFSATIREAMNSV